MGEELIGANASAATSTEYEWYNRAAVSPTFIRVLIHELPKYNGLTDGPLSKTTKLIRRPDGSSAQKPVACAILKESTQG